VERELECLEYLVKRLERIAAESRVASVQAHSDWFKGYHLGESSAFELSQMYLANEIVMLRSKVK